jgi:DNA recombination protein RmuC
MATELGLVTVVLALVVILVLGLLMGFWLARRMNSGQTEVIAERVRSESATEVATARERVRGLEADAQKLDGELQRLKVQSDEWRAALDAARDDRAQLAERAARVPVVEAQLTQVTTHYQGAQQDILRLSKSEAEKASELASEQDRSAELEASFAGDRKMMMASHQQLTAKADQMQADLDATREDRTQLSERAARVPTLDRQLEELNLQFQASQAEILRLSKSEAEKAREIASLGPRNTELADELSASMIRVQTLAESLSHAQARCAGLESENVRILQLDQRLSIAEGDNTRLQNNLAALREDIGRVQAELQAEKEAHAIVRTDLADKKQEQERAQAEVSDQKSQLTELTTRLESERQQSQDKLTLLIEAKEALSNQFKSLASDILEEKSKRFAEQNQASLGQLLDPLKVKLQEFQGKVELFYDTEGKQRSALSQQVTQLLDLNKTLSDDAKNLTMALKGSSKSQGSWGELILERVLEASGLRKGEEYEVQESHTRDDGSRAQPDVVIHLPEDRHLVVDAKVSLSAYEEFASAEDDVVRQASLRRHLDSIRGHIKGLSERNYQALYGIKSLDFVLMFVPIEPAFMVGVTQDNKLFMDAWAKNVLLVSPSTLLFVVRTVAHLWRQEAQSRNAQDIAERGAQLYDRLSAFVVDLEKVGERLNQAQVSYSDAFAKLATNKGNVIRQAEMLKELGVKPTKALPAALLELAIEHEKK